MEVDEISCTHAEAVVVHRMFCDNLDDLNQAFYPKRYLPRLAGYRLLEERSFCDSLSPGTLYA